MALEWNITKPIERHGREAFFRPDGTDSDGKQLYSLDATAEHLIWSTIFVGIGELTESTASEFYARLNLWEKVHGPSVIGPEGPVFTTPADVQKLIGLRTNVFPMDTRAKFIKRLTTRVLDEGANKYHTDTADDDGEATQAKLDELRAGSTGE